MREVSGRGILDTSVVISLETLDMASLPKLAAVSAITMAELAAGPHATADAAERARRQDRLQRAEATFDALPCDATIARAYGLLYAEALRAGTKPRGRRAFDLLIAATALANGLPLYTTNPGDFTDLTSLIDIVEPSRMVASAEPAADRGQTTDPDPDQAT